MAKIGRPRALCDTKRREVCTLVSAGCDMAEAARYVGCTVRTVRREALRNEDFHDSLRRAELSAQLDPLHTLRKAAKNHWRAAAWLLERTNPDRYARQDPYAIRPEQHEDIMLQVVDLLMDEITDNEIRTRIYHRLLMLKHNASQEASAATRPRRDPKRSKRMLSA